MRTVRADRRTLPSSTAATFNLRATVAMSGCCPSNENDDVRAATCSSLIRESESSSSSVKPSEKYSCSLSPLMFTNGSTAMEWGGGWKASGGVAGDVALDVMGGAAGLENRGLLMSRYASAARTSAATATGTARLDGEAVRAVEGTGDELEVVPVCNRSVVRGSGDSRRLMRATNSGGVSPLGKRVHC